MNIFIYFSLSFHHHLGSFNSGSLSGDAGIIGDDDDDDDDDDEQIALGEVQHASLGPRLLIFSQTRPYSTELTAAEMPSSPEEMQALSLIDNDSSALVLPEPLAISVNPKNNVLLMDGLDHHHHRQTPSSIPSNPSQLPLSQNNSLPSCDLLPGPPAFNSTAKPSSLNGPRQALANTTCPTTAGAATAVAPSTPPRPQRATPSNNNGNTHSSVPIDSRSSLPSDFELGSASEEAYDAVTADAASDAPVVSVNEIEGACGCPNANSAGGKLKRQRALCPDEGGDMASFRVRKALPNPHSPTAMRPRPAKKARIDENNVGVFDGVANGLRIVESRDDVGENAPRNRKDNVQLPPCTRIPVRESEREPEADAQNSLVATPPRMTASPSLSPSHSPPFSRPPPPTRFQSSSSCPTLASGSPFPKTPPPLNHGNSNGSVAGSPPPATSSTFPPSNGIAPASGPQQFWFEDGDLVLLVSSPSQPVVSSDPFAPSARFNGVSEVIHVGQEAAPSGPIPFRIHAARLALASKSFASLLTTKLSQNPSKDDSARAASAIAARLNGCRRRGLACEPFYHTVGYHQAKSFGADEGEYQYEIVGGCPAIRLEGDSPKDWMVALEAIYEPMSFQVRPIVFDALGRALRISTRYGMQTLRDWALTQLRTTWPAQVERMAPIALPHAADAIMLAKSCDVPDILPAAFYALAIQRWRPAPVHMPSARAVSAVNMLTSSPMSSAKPNFSTAHIADSLVSEALSPNHGTGMSTGVEVGGTDGGRAHTILDPIDLRRLVVGREALHDILVEIISDPLSIGRSMYDDDDSGDFGGNLGVRGGEEGKIDTYPALGVSYPGPPSPSPSPKVQSAAAANSSVGGGANMNASGLMSGTPSPALSHSSGTTEATLVHGGVVHNRRAAQSYSSFSALGPSSSSSNPYFSTFPPNGAAADGACLSTSVSPPNFTFCSPGTSPCRSTLESLWRSRLASDGKRPWATWLARELYRLASLPRGTEPGAGLEFTFDNGPLVGKAEAITAGDNDAASPAGKHTSAGGKGKVDFASDVCASCWEENRRLALWRLDWLCAEIPRMFML